jgi:hypothetical protein
VSNDQKAGADRVSLRPRNAKMDALTKFAHSSDRFRFDNVVRDVGAATAAAQSAPKSDRPADRDA